MEGEIANWKVMDWLQAGVHVIGLVGGVAGACLFLARKMRRFKKIKYPVQGEAGPNLLAPGVVQIKQGQHVALSAVVPDDTSLVVVIQGEPEPAPPVGQMPMPSVPSMGGWFYSLAPGPLNWRGNRYSAGNPATGPVQTFTARGGPAELDMHFGRPGPVTLQVYEKGDVTPTWTKEIHVLP
ncbi:hypothetical protein [Stenotrophomonas bentonitica]|uniref:hypothetical protein n=1 Tax=Stenotrophomonas bentonitica TaxID=1450134 RepID=UPI000C9B6242|nr:hypothetical protein [Stenotrophomonas bentonitica]